MAKAKTPEERAEKLRLYNEQRFAAPPRAAEPDYAVTYAAGMGEAPPEFPAPKPASSALYKQLAEWRAKYFDDPVGFVENVLGAEPEPYQADFMRAVARGDRQIAIRSGHGIGKTAMLAWLVVWHLCMRFPQRTVCTAASGAQLFDALAAEIKTWCKKLPKFILDNFIEIQVEHIFFKPAPTESYVSFRVSKAETPEALAGTHSKHMLLIADEASGVPDAIFDSATGSMSGGDEIDGGSASLLLAGNPLHSSGTFYDIFNTDQAADWTLFHVSCTESKRVSQSYIDAQERKYGGRDTSGFRTRVLGDFPLTEDNTFIDFSLAMATLERDVEPINVQPIWGLDVARYGSDRSALVVRKGNVLPEQPRTWKDLSTMELVGRIKDKWDNTLPSSRPSAICVDSIGLGAGVVDRLIQLDLPAVGVNVAESPALKDQYNRLKDELWAKARDWFTGLDSRAWGTDERGTKWKADELIREITLPQYKYNATGKLQIESKDELRKRKKKSPDLADAMVLTFAVDAVVAGNSNSSGWRHASWKKTLGWKNQGIA